MHAFLKQISAIKSDIKAEHQSARVSTCFFSFRCVSRDKGFVWSNWLHQKRKELRIVVVWMWQSLSNKACFCTHSWVIAPRTASSEPVTFLTDESTSIAINKHLVMVPFSLPNTTVETETKLSVFQNSSFVLLRLYPNLPIMESVQFLITKLITSYILKEYFL